MKVFSPSIFLTSRRTRRYVNRLLTLSNAQPPCVRACCRSFSSDSVPRCRPCALLTVTHWRWRRFQRSPCLRGVQMVCSHPCFARDNKIHCPRGAHYARNITIIRWRGFFYYYSFHPRAYAVAEFWSPQCRARAKSRESWSVRERKPIPSNNSNRMVGRVFVFR